ncbi:MAG TPA: SET domain-containing protein [Pyrinomonadaceae bacterium]|nr:SET domain-containing protein [Pyrinomonadaceae bacterium]
MSKENGKFAVRRTNTGLGLFTLKTIPFNKRIIEYVGTILTNEEVEKRTGKYFFELDEKRSIDGSSRQNLARYINHSCRPNARGYTTGNRIWIWSLREIKAGEQITINYGKSYFNDHIKPVGCKCEKCAK